MGHELHRSAREGARVALGLGRQRVLQPWSLDRWVLSWSLPAGELGLSQTVLRTCSMLR